MFITIPKAVWEHVIRPAAITTWEWLLKPIGSFVFVTIPKTIFITIPLIAYNEVLRPIGQTIYDRLLTPLGRGLIFLHKKIQERQAIMRAKFALLANWTEEVVLKPIGRGISSFAGYLINIPGAVYRNIFTPLGQTLEQSWIVVEQGIVAAWKKTVRFFEVKPQANLSHHDIRALA